MATGEVHLLGTVIGTPGSFASNGNTVAKCFDGLYGETDGTHWDSPNADNSWAGIDLGSGNSSQLMRAFIAPRPSTSGGEHEHKIVGAQVQSSNDETFASVGETAYTIPGVSSGTWPFGPKPFLPRYELSELPAAGAAAYRAHRLLVTYDTAFGSVAEIVFYGTPTNGNSKPCKPTMDYTGGRFLTAPVSVAVSSRTTSATLHYTTDGSTPTQASTLVSGGTISVTPTHDGTTLKVVAYDATCSTALSDVESGTFYAVGFQPNTDWRDTKGRLIEAHDGHVGYVAPYYYWLGVHANYRQAGDDIGHNHGVWLYRSTDLKNWLRLGKILDNTSLEWRYIERPHWAYNETTGKYVLIAHASNDHDSTDRMVIAEADDIEGDWEWVDESHNPDGVGFKDCNLFVDDDGTAYIVYTRGDQSLSNISRLEPDWHSTTGDTFTTSGTGNRESPCIFKRNGKYIWITSVGNYYDPLSTFDIKYQVSDDILSGWANWSTGTTIFSSDPVGTDFAMQPTQVFQVPGKSDGFILMGDRWGHNGSAKELYKSRYVWVPLAFPTDSTVKARRWSNWELSVFAATRKTLSLEADGERYAVGVG